MRIGCFWNICVQVADINMRDDRSLNEDLSSGKLPLKETSKCLDVEIKLTEEFQ